MFFCLISVPCMPVYQYAAVIFAKNSQVLRNMTSFNKWLNCGAHAWAQLWNQAKNINSFTYEPYRMKIAAHDVWLAVVDFSLCFVVNLLLVYFISLFLCKKGFPASYIYVLPGTDWAENGGSSDLVPSVSSLRVPSPHPDINVLSQHKTLGFI